MLQASVKSFELVDGHAGWVKGSENYHKTFLQRIVWSNCWLLVFSRRPVAPACTQGYKEWESVFKVHSTSHPLKHGGT